MKRLQDNATKVFKYASVAFGVVGILMILTTNGDDNEPLSKLLFVIAFIILPSFALSVAGKYLDDK